ncbi:GbsR/MarR family transcriptional regulator [Lentzea sp. NPDC060358]|uniref:GbsR/MarR family transcriptional regulator n=1 Tax=Lentzea sp. NPDC060358 TaxID=3347103 RepID=UPI003666AB91
MTRETERRLATEHMALTLVGAGMQRMGARVLSAFLFTEKESLTAGDLAEELGVSAGSVSAAVRMVVQMGVVERVYVEGSRREHFRMLDNAWTTLYSRQHSVVDAVLGAVEAGVEAVGPGRAHDRLEYMRDFYTFLVNESPVLVERFERQRARDKRRGEPRP